MTIGTERPTEIFHKTTTLRHVLGSVAVLKDQIGMAGSPMDVRAFEFPDSYLVSLRWRESFFKGKRFLNALTQARPRTVLDDFLPQVDSAILGDWNLSDYPTQGRNPELLALHKKIPGWEEFDTEDRRKFMDALDNRVEGIGLNPYYMWSVSKEDGSRAVVKESPDRIVEASLNSEANRRLGLVVMTGFSPHQRDSLSINHSAERRGKLQTMGEAQIPLLLTVYESRILRGRVFEAVEELTGISTPSTRRNLRRMITEVVDLTRGGTKNAVVPFLQAFPVGLMATGVIMAAVGLADVPVAGIQLAATIFDSDGANNRAHILSDMRPGFGQGFDRGNKDIALVLGGIILAGGTLAVISSEAPYQD